MRVGEKWHNHDPEDVIENDNSKILWDFDIQTGQNNVDSIL